jgi:hypothetical protein
MASEDFENRVSTETTSSTNSRGPKAAPLPACLTCKSNSDVNFTGTIGEWKWTSPFWDTDGNKHLHDTNVITGKYRCWSCDTTWMVPFNNECWCGWSSATNGATDAPTLQHDIRISITTLDSKEDENLSSSTGVTPVAAAAPMPAATTGLKIKDGFAVGVDASGEEIPRLRVVTDVEKPISRVHSKGVLNASAGGSEDGGESSGNSSPRSRSLSALSWGKITSGIKMPSCPKCSENANVSGGSRRTLMLFYPFWDDQGKIHSHDENEERARYECRTCKEEWDVKIEHKCWCGWIQGHDEMGYQGTRHTTNQSKNMSELFRVDEEEKKKKS